MAYHDVMRLRCPACLSHSMYDGVLSIAPQCPACGFTLKRHDVGDGAAFFAMFLSSIIVVIAALILDAWFVMPLWLHAVIWGVATVILSVYFLRVIKAYLIHQEYKHNIGDYRS